MTFPTAHRQDLSSVVIAAQKAIHDDPAENKYRIFAATRAQIAVRNPIRGFRMHNCWLLIHSRTIKGQTQLEFWPLTALPIPLVGFSENDQAFIQMLTGDHCHFGGETIVYEKGDEPKLTGDILTSDIRITTCLRAPRTAKTLRPIELEVIEYDGQLILNGPENFFVPDSIKEVNHGIFSANKRPISNFVELPIWTALQPNDSDDNLDDDYTALIDIASDPDLHAIRTVLIPTLWLPDVIGLDYQTDWQMDAKGFIWTGIGPFDIEHELTDTGVLETRINYNP